MQRSVINSANYHINFPRYILKRIAGIIVLAFVAGLFSFAVSRFFIVPLYESNATIYVEKADGDKQGENDDELISTCIELLTSDNVCNEVSNIIERLPHERYSMRALREMTTVEREKNSRIIKISVKNESPAIACEIANAIAEKGTELISVTVSDCNVKVIDHAQMRSIPVFPNVRVFTVVGFLIGFAGALAIYTIRWLMFYRKRKGNQWR